ncbi:hypothetical protein [Alicyclobacillus dauci]|uniref:Uncharacterized protein n=1 Tax=Alicyclobacillus dauci TaxID=1475485 RepID=A0ABY6Z6L2_9BACL|nr:hypothetical protein [Alicyclobacillus dauci]WAH37670.1 hypothetical protein NZD86_03925 [Alicyclobacillus dauci]
MKKHHIIYGSAIAVAAAILIGTGFQPNAIPPTPMFFLNLLGF